MADGDVNLETGEGVQLLVDGLQRVSTLVQYFNADPDLKLTTVPAYRDLRDDHKTSFLQYDVAVRDLGSIPPDEIVEVFRRINATKYSLTDIEVSNAVYRGALKEFAERLSVNEFFSDNGVFTASDYRRMGDLRFAVLLVITVIGSYSNRDDRFEEFLARYNDEFDDAPQLDTEFQKVFDFITECGFPHRSRVWRKADLFTIIVELYFALCKDHLDLQPHTVVDILTNFYTDVDARSLGQDDLPGIYYKATLQASNDRLNRVRRGIIIGGLIRGAESAGILDALRREDLA